MSIWTDTEPDVFRLVQAWEPPKTPACSNCRHAIVSRDPAEPTVACEAGHGKRITLWRLIRRSRPIGFRAASECPDFSSMSDEP